MAKSHPSSSKTLKRRRPNKKLVATLESLGDALADIDDEIQRGIAEGEDGEGMDSLQKTQGKVRHKSLKSRPGALKRKERVVKGEMERFGQSLAQLVTVKEGTTAGQQQPSTTAPAGKTAQEGDGMDVETEGQTAVQEQSATSNRWAALRGFISATMEQNPAFLSKT